MNSSRRVCRFCDTSIESNRTLIDDIEGHTPLLADAKVVLIATNYTAAGVMNSLGAIDAQARAATKIMAVTTIEAGLAACDALDAKELVLVTACDEHVVTTELAFFEQRVLIVADASCSARTPFGLRTLPPKIYSDIVTRVLDDYDVLLISCAGIRASSVIASIGTEVGRPANISNCALF